MLLNTLKFTHSFPCIQRIVKSEMEIVTLLRNVEYYSEREPCMLGLLANKGGDEEHLKKNLSSK